MDQNKFNDLVHRHIGVFNLLSKMKQNTPTYYKHIIESKNQFLLIGKNQEYVLGKVKDRDGVLSLQSNHGYTSMSIRYFTNYYKIDISYILNDL